MKRNKSKYNLIVSHVTDRISTEHYRLGDRIPSINEFRNIYNLSRDTVFAGLRDLVAKGIITPNHGVGYFITSIEITSGHHIFLLFNELNGFKEVLFNSLVASLDKEDTVDLYFHNYNRKIFEKLIREANNKYTDYVIMSGKFTDIGPLLDSLSGRVFMLDHFDFELKGRYSAVFQDFEKNTYEALCSGLEMIKKYKRIWMVQKEEKEPEERYEGLKAFCREHQFEHEYITEIGNRTLGKGDLYIVVKDEDLADLIKQATIQNFIPGSDFGIISYNDTPLKEVLAGGITTLSTDFKHMGKTMAKLIETREICTIENPWQLNVRRSL